MFKINPVMLAEPISDTELMVLDTESQSVHLLNETAFEMYGYMQEMEQDAAVTKFIEKYQEEYVQVDEEGNKHKVGYMELKNHAESIIDLLFEINMLIKE